MIDGVMLSKNPDLVTGLTKKEIINLLAKSKKHFEKKKRLIRLKGFKKVIFVGDIHGDFDSVKIIVKKYLNKENAIVFLGDYVDRGCCSIETINFLLLLTLGFPNIFLLMGNHEAFPVIPCYPNDFWQELKEKSLYKYYADVLTKLPLVITVKNIILLHAGLPNIKKLEEINKIRIKDDDNKFFSIIWDDFMDEPGYRIRTDIFTGRKKFGESYFDKIMNNLNKKILIRGHDYNVKGSIFHNRCLTLLTSKSYADKGLIKGRLIAIGDLTKKISCVDDLKIEKI